MALAPRMDDGQFFELFCAVELLKPYDLDLDEIQSGVLGGGGDGGIDGFFVFVDGEPLDAVEAHQRRSRDCEVEVVIFQAKATASFSGAAVDKLVSTVSTIFDFSRETTGLRKLYSEELLEKVERFRNFFAGSIARIARVAVRYYYFSTGDYVHDALAAQADTLRATSERLFPDAQVTVEFAGAQQLLQMARTSRPEWLELPVREGPLVAGDSGYVALIGLSEYARFITDERGNRRRALFMENVRDYEGKYGVNSAIAETLEHPSDDDFWMLNNGITIVARQARNAYKNLALQDPKIVNGLQTTTEIFEYFRRRADQNDDRMVLVRVVLPETEASRDRIIVATNKQTPIAAGVLKATERVHRDIEDYLRPHGFYYERRRNEHRNDGKSLDVIVTMPFLARAMVSVCFRSPHRAVKVNANKKLLDSPEVYERLFGVANPLDAYLNTVLIMKRIEGFIASERTQSNSDDTYLGKSRRPSLWYAQWHLGTYMAMLLTHHQIPGPAEVACLTSEDIEGVYLPQVAMAVREVLRDLREVTKRNEYQCAKTALSVDKLWDAVGAAAKNS